MKIEKLDLNNWNVRELNSIYDERKIKNSILFVESELKIRLPLELKELISLANDNPILPADECDCCLAKYNNSSLLIDVVIIFNGESIVNSTKISQESIYDKRFLLPNGLIAIGSSYDDSGDAYLIYDVRPDSATYKNVFHWRYYADNLIAGEGLGFIAHSLKEFLSMPTSEDEL
ncbi:SMI1/KNR4 family protein [Pectobacterium brasiliense]|uniref:SMI1/KNR4 family protein n=1 Tax=Pectobacterium brasiliense TaxID=180957 RepID=UPI0015DF1515|nr:SMI1/KNR4 family protein [Pectobacterium brasiliense]MBA0219848.1 SMI1/KNR4 family protein [Pectobacterium brasiliense]MBN3071322.1 SMI1/KNR4 family protein [Pectobacterium brasiliense]MBN3171856.1 SMI1/KNR4 family protein [Pectobacterium brasiliense]